MSIIEYFRQKYRRAADESEIDRIVDFESTFVEFFMLADVEEFNNLCDLYGIDVTAEEDGKLALQVWARDWGA